MKKRRLVVFIFGAVLLTAAAALFIAGNVISAGVISSADGPTVII